MEENEFEVDTLLLLVNEYSCYKNLHSNADFVIITIPGGT